MGRPKLWFDKMHAWFAAGTFDRIAAVLEPNEERKAFVREAVEREIERRQLAIGKVNQYGL
jgi:hypothetical protein